MADEFSRIDEILRRLQQVAPHVDVANGDDAAVLQLDGRTVLSVDAAVEGTHFRREWLTFRELGVRATTAALSDLAAMGSYARAMLTSLVVPSDVTEHDLYALADGCADVARQHGAPVVGGNLSRGRELSLTTTVIGVIGGRPMVRSGAKVGDVIYVTGTLGAAAIGLQCLLQQRHDAAASVFVTRWKQPTARLREGQLIAPLATAAIDVSDGLVQDLTHLCRASGVGARIHADVLPLAAQSDAMATALGVNAIDLALGGGEDYELLFTAARDASIPCDATAIGEVTHDTNVVVIEGGSIRDPRRQHGFRHFE